MMLSVLIPTRGRVALLERCLRSLAVQEISGFDVEVIVGIDGPDSGEVSLAERLSTSEIPMRAMAAPHAGPAVTRNRVVGEAIGETLLFLNDDVEAAPGVLAAHARAQGAFAARGELAMALGSAPWAIEQPDRVMDRLVRETSAVFFYDQMVGARAADPSYDWGWRHAWALNLSMPARCVREVGGFCESMRRPVYEDIELAFRVHERFGAPTLHEPGARVVHHHRYEPVALLAREYTLGHQSHRLAEVSPECAFAIFGRNLLAADSIASARPAVESDRPEASGEIAALMGALLGPGSAVDANGIETIYAQYAHCREYLRAMGLADAGRGMDCDPPLVWLNKIETSIRALC